MTSEPRGPGGPRAGALVAAAVAAGVALAPPGAAAQGVVRGRVSLLDAPGDRPGDVREAVVYLVPSGGGAPAGDADAAAGAGAAAPLAASIDMRGREFRPHVRMVQAGGTVAFPNSDPFSHNVFSNTALGAFDLGLYRHRASRSARFERPGVYPIYCNIHHRMVSFVVAVPARWAAQPDAAGRFALEGVPAGRYVLHAWHERSGEVARPLVVAGTGADDADVVLDARGYVPAPHLNKFGLPYTATRADRY